MFFPRIHRRAEANLAYSVAAFRARMSVAPLGGVNSCKVIASRRPGAAGLELRSMLEACKGTRLGLMRTRRSCMMQTTSVRACVYERRARPGRSDGHLVICSQKQ